MSNNNQPPKQLRGTVAMRLPATFHHLSELPSPKQQRVLVDKNTAAVPNAYYQTEAYKIQEHWKPISKTVRPVIRHE